MKVNIKNLKDLELRYSMRMYIIYENIMGKSMTFTSDTSYTSLIVLFYAAIMATLQRENKSITFTYDEYMDWLDDNEPQTLITEFSKWFTEKVTESIKMTPKPTKEQEETATKENSKNS